MSAGNYDGYINTGNFNLLFKLAIETAESERIRLDARFLPVLRTIMKTVCEQTKRNVDETSEDFNIRLNLTTVAKCKKYITSNYADLRPRPSPGRAPSSVELEDPVDTRVAVGLDQKLTSKLKERGLSADPEDNMKIFMRDKELAVGIPLEKLIIDDVVLENYIHMPEARLLELRSRRPELFKIVVASILTRHNPTQACPSDCPTDSPTTIGRIVLIDIQRNLTGRVGAFFYVTINTKKFGNKFRIRSCTLPVSCNNLFISIRGIQGRYSYGDTSFITRLNNAPDHLGEPAADHDIFTITSNPVIFSFWSADHKIVQLNPAIIGSIDDNTLSLVKYLDKPDPHFITVQPHHLVPGDNILFHAGPRHVTKYIVRTIPSPNEFTITETPSVLSEDLAIVRASLSIVVGLEIA